MLGYYLICRVLAEEFGFDKATLMDRDYHASCLVKTFSNEQLATLPHDAPCPCESGRALGDCHLS